MRAYRVFPYRVGARSGEAGHALYVPPAQRGGRLDNPDHYSVRYLAESPSAAVAERFGELAEWTAGMFLTTAPSHRLSLATFEVPDAVRRLELDDAQALVERGLRPTQVVRRNKKVTQAWALGVYEEKASTRGSRRWDGVRWWSWYRPEWTVVGMWSGECDVVDVERLDLRHPAVVEAALLLGRVVRPAR